MSTQTTEIKDSEKKSPKRFLLPIFVAIIVIVGGWYGIKSFVFSLNHVSTDDAQIDGDISPVIARVTGYADTVIFEDNDKVTKGQLLVKLDDRDLQIKVNQAQSALDNASANALVTKANVSTFEANQQTALSNLDAAKIKQAKANTDLTRYQALIKDKAITQNEFDAIKAAKDNADAQVLVAQKQVDAARTQTASSEGQIKVAESAVTQKQSDLDFAKLQLSYTRVVAPFAGTVSKKGVEPGQLLQAGQTLCSVVSDTGITVTANFKETQVEEIKIGQAVEVTVDAFPDKKIMGKVYSFSGASGARFSLLPPDNASGNFVKVVQRIPVKMRINADAETMKLLRPGMSVNVAVVTK